MISPRTASGVAVSSSEHVYAADLNNDRIQAFHWKPFEGGPGGGSTEPGVAIK